MQHPLAPTHGLKTKGTPLINYLQDMWNLAAQAEPQGIWFWAAAYAAVICAYSLVYQLRIRSWPSTEGELVQAGAQKFGATDLIKSDQDYVSTALYRFRVSGQQFTGRRVSPWIIIASHNARFVLNRQMSSIEFLSGDKVRVYHHPRKPHKSFLIKPGAVGLFITALAGALPMILYLYEYHR